MLRADFHSHTIYSYDCNSTIPSIIKRCKKMNVNCVASTDHNEIEGAYELKKHAPFKVIIGEEIESMGGELIGLFLKEKIEAGMSFKDTIKAIKEQKGLVYLPHPVSGVRKSKLDPEEIEENIDDIDIIEIYNSRTMFAQDEAWVKDLIRKYDKATAGGSDAHSPWEFGNFIMELPEFNTAEELLESLKKSNIIQFKTTTFIYRALLNHRVRKLSRWIRGYGR